MFLQRAAISLTLGPLLIYLILLGGWLYFIPVFIFLIIATVEYVRLTGALGRQVPIWLLLPTTIALWFDGQLSLGLMAPILGLSLFAALCYALYLYERQKSGAATTDWFALVAGIMLLGWVASYFFRLPALDVEWPRRWTVLAMVATWLADSGAYVFGKRFGRRKLSPRLSPNKTIEGYVSGIIVSLIGSYIAFRLLQLDNLALALTLSLLVSVFATAGDLGISMLKREAGVKDSGNILPGHGGALDRIDSLAWAMVLAYFLVSYLA